MALSLGISKGSKIQVGSSIIEVVEVSHGTHIQVSVNGRKFLITGFERTEVLPEVFLSCGLTDERHAGTFSRLAIEAPKSVKIHRLGDPHDHRKH